MTRELTIYSTSPALRQAQARIAEADGFCDSRGMISVRTLMNGCAMKALDLGLLRGPGGAVISPVGDLERDLAVVAAAARFRKEAAGEGALGGLSEASLEEVIIRLAAYVDPLADVADRFVEMLAADENAKNRELARLYRVYDEALLDLGFASEARVNAAILAVLSGDRGQWPAMLWGVRAVNFTGLRWVPPFIEVAARVLAGQLGRENVRLVHILEDYEQEWWGATLMAQAGTLVFGGEVAQTEWSEFNARETAASILGMMNHLGELRDGYAMLDTELASGARGRVGFSQSVGLYGEVEDLARRIAWLLENGKCRPQDIAFCARNLGDYSDAVTNVFSRFGIPYCFRRGVPVMSIAVVKDVLNLVNFSASRKRDTFCSLLDSPWLDWHRALAKADGWVVEPQELADAIRRSGVEPEIKTEEVLVRRLEGWFSRGGEATAGEKAKAAGKAFRMALGRVGAATLGEAVDDIFARCGELGIAERLKRWGVERGRSRRDAASHILNARGFGAVMDVLGDLRNIRQYAERASVNWYETVSVASRCISNLTIADPGSTSSGVWVVTPFDMAGLRFRVVMAAGLNSGMFPVAPSQSPIFSDADLARFRDGLSTKELPGAALAGSRARNSQENLLFLSILAAADESVVFSRFSRDETGQEQASSVFYSTLWRLVGWASFGDDFPVEPPDEYDRWRLRQAPGIFGRHWADQELLPAHERTPFHGESFLACIPPELCRAADEARQTAVLKPADDIGADGVEEVAAIVSRSLDMETARGGFFDRLAAGVSDERVDPARGDVVGEIGRDLAKEFLPDAGEPVDFSTTALQDLANCPYKYYLGRILGLEPLQTNELEASPIDFGSAIHRVMETGFLLLLGENKRAEEKFGGVPDLLAAGIPGRLAAPAYIVRVGSTWRFLGRADSPPAGALPVVVLDPGRKEEYLLMFRKLCDAFRECVCGGDEQWKLGPVEQVDIQWDQIRTGACSLIEAQLGLADGDYAVMAGGVGGSSYIRCTALLEHVFDSRKYPRHRPDAPSLEYSDTGGSGDALRIHGVIDRVDLLFDAAGDNELRALLVLDYKGTSKNKSADKLAEDIVAARDCQLPVYGDAARVRFLGGCDSAIPVVCQYLIYRLSSPDNLSVMRNRWIALDGRPVDAEILEELCGGDLVGAFRRRVFECFRTLREGRFTVRPDSCDYCDYRSVCRFSMPALENDDGVA